jgi:nucleoside-diphosphate-sugar epimerase
VCNEEGPVRIVVTGASGNLGSALLPVLVRQGHELTAVCRRVPDASPPAGAVAGVSWVRHDLADRSGDDRLAEVLRGADAVVHLAWGLQPMHHRDHLRRVDLGGTVACLRAAGEAGVPHFVFASSVGAYSPRTSEARVTESFPTGGIPTSTYSRHKSLVEAVLDDAEQDTGARPRISRIRPSLVGQRAAGSALLRIGFPMLLPAPLLRRLLVLPLDRDFRLQFVHADDVADALARILLGRHAGAFNLAADDVLSQEDIAASFGARGLHLPRAWALRTTSAAWHARLQPLDPGWLDMAFSVPRMDSGRARQELGWRPRHTARAVLDEVVQGMADRADGPYPPLRRRTLRDDLGQLLRAGPVSHRPQT